MRQKVIIGMLALAAIIFVRNLYAISVLPDEVNQGQIFRIIFFHVPAAAAAMTGSAVAAGTWKKMMRKIWPWLTSSGKTEMA